MIFNIGGSENTKGKMPEFTYSGIYQLLDDGKNGSTQNWRIKFLTSGTLKFTKVVDEIDLFLVGGGGSAASIVNQVGGGNAGGGGYTKTQKRVPVEAGKSYEILVGAGGAENPSHNTPVNGSPSSAFGYSADGGYGGGFTAGGNGGSGGGGGYDKSGNGGSDGGNGGGASGESYRGGYGQGSTTREFGESGATLYAGGGGGTKTGVGGAGGGGSSGSAGVANTGGGGGGRYSYGTPGCAGGSGIVVIRNAR